MLTKISAKDDLGKQAKDSCRSFYKEFSVQVF